MKNINIIKRFLHNFGTDDVGSNGRENSKDGEKLTNVFKFV